ncbi:DUF2975 domain-containing protein [Hymenobacter weizhouensis]|uniref:DUF2975 domain-containing protein n=1 Tax=Hymenobacter sp. YIM 151500-1 TaxID=2987689 RepID=UPI002227C2B3|nr:DUF2975 domain-containing protein [Hymenobacter sp. YIM 151500-1]UYZ62802.1 DUF2975 domain-containing protein [Hymenobacter sp. YIM 151500-1]
MATFSLNTLLRLTRPLMAFFLLFGLLLLPLFLLKTLEVGTDEKEVKLKLDTTAPNVFTEVRAYKKGFEDGWHGRSMERWVEPPTLRADSSGFALTADPTAPTLRYQEDSTWKRISLLYLGASDGYLSLALMIFFLVGSWQLWLLLLDVTPTTPFTYASARRLRTLALLVLGLDLWHELSSFMVRELVPPFRVPRLDEPLGHYVELNTYHTLPGWEVGLMFLIIAGVYQRGVELSQEAELTI